jgi:hypothetical protein
MKTPPLTSFRRIVFVLVFPALALFLAGLRLEYPAPAGIIINLVFIILFGLLLALAASDDFKLWKRLNMSARA